MKYRHQHAFTIVELILVIAVIGILATITIISYSGWRKSTTAAVLQSDLEQSASQLQATLNTSGSYPASLSAANLPTSKGTVYTYAVASNQYCLTASNGTQTYYITSSNTTPAIGACPTQTYTVATLAGSGTAGFINGTGSGASFHNPQGIAIDTSGNLYIADTINCVIRKITPAGVVTTFAGSGTCSITDGTGTGASFMGPTGIAIDSSGNLYVTDGTAIRKITPAGVVTTFAGSTASGSTNGTGTAARFSSANAIAIDNSGNLYVADSYNYLIRKITPAAVVTTLAGSGAAGSTNGTGTAASFNLPYGVAVDSSGNVYVADKGNQLIRKITPAAVVTTLAGSGAIGSADGTGTAASFKYPYGMTIDSSGNLYVSDTSNNEIRKVTSSGVVTTIAGTGAAGANNGFASSATFSSPYGLAFNSAGVLYVVDNGNHMVRALTPN